MDDFSDFNYSIQSEYDRFASESFLNDLENPDVDEEIPIIENYEPVKEDVEEDTNNSNWFIYLSNVPNAIKIEEFGHEYIYGRLKDPDGKPTDKFYGFFKNKDTDSEWKSLPGVLSGTYMAVSLEKFINSEIIPKFRNIDISIYNKEPWKLSWMGIIDDDVDYIDKDTIYSILKNIDVSNSIEAINSKFGFIVSNTYNGTNKLRISPIVKTVIKFDNGEDFEFIDYFTFSNFTQVISHSSEDSFENSIDIIKENVSEHISILKEYTNTTSIIRNISKCFKKPTRTMFKNILNSETCIIEPNLFNIILISSISLSRKYSIIEYLPIRSKMELLFEQIF
jgi:hypothetical protein